jgi:hypothetical protein
MACTQGEVVGNSIGLTHSGGILSLTAVGIYAANSSGRISDNTIAASTEWGIDVAGGQGLIVSGNRVGMSPDGLTWLPNRLGGRADVTHALLHHYVLLGGRQQADANILAPPMEGPTLEIAGQVDAVGNRIGLLGDGTVIGPGEGPTVVVRAFSRLGGILRGESNHVAVHPSAAGPAVFVADAGWVSGNRYSLPFGTMPVDLAVVPESEPDGPTANDPGDVDEGSNGALNFPELQNASFAAQTLTVMGGLEIVPGRYLIELYTIEDCAAREMAGDAEFVGSGLIEVDQGPSAFAISVPRDDVPSLVVAVTHALEGGVGTSEFGNCVPVTQGNADNRPIVESVLLTSILAYSTDVPIVIRGRGFAPDATVPGFSVISVTDSEIHALFEGPIQPGTTALAVWNGDNISSNATLIPSRELHSRADVDRNGCVNLADALAAKRYIAGHNITAEPVCGFIPQPNGSGRQLRR